MSARTIPPHPQAGPDGGPENGPAADADPPPDAGREPARAGGPDAGPRAASGDPPGAGRPPLRVSLFDLGPPPPCPGRFNMARHTLEGPGLPGAGPAPDAKIALTAIGPDGAERWSYGRLRESVRRAAEGLRRLGLAPGARVLLRLGNEPRFALMFFGAAGAGLVPVPTSEQLTAAELARLIAAAEPAAILCADALRGALDAACAGLAGAAPPALGDAEMAALLRAPVGDFADTAADDPAFMIFTSGATGAPKGVLHAHRSAWARRMMWRGWYGLTPDDVMLHAGAFNWTYTLGAGLTDPWAAGAATVVRAAAPGAPRNPAVWAELMRAHRATIFAAAPGVHRQLLKSGADLRAMPALRHGLTAGERAPDALREAWRAATGTELYEALGMSEISTYISSSPDTPPRPGAAGRPQPGRRVAVLDEAGAPVPVGSDGMLAVSRRDPGLMLGYWNAPPPWRGEWFLTGDAARMDADGYVTHLGRADEVMNALGYRVSPAEVEEALSAHPDVAECAAAALPVRADLEIIAAFVVPRPGAAPDADAILAAAAERLAPYKRPREVIFVPELPRTANGKVRRAALAAAHRRDGAG
ncbi:acyl-CoA synthetase [Oceanicella actignis]|uniref:Acyl-coenzyme A synthetase/AMP-(Fatty) acid ligase n=1 Tax=Oceanicella actignis TaxID=1189325 RepID=A0A1M7S8S2_9RHOB|nr:AMP-binding protein [Oceanicella actignis]SET32118.1 Acyl-coenzyme A synthetase/AMP-(fatty) acid ligase [Oceanicella actignis]SHN54843.1 Acyl-coenzyme A synthetase/AMP-(fatty) acid ligase [Oceanicella actignis]